MVCTTFRHTHMCLFANFTMRGVWNELHGLPRCRAVPNISSWILGRSVRYNTMCFLFFDGVSSFECQNCITIIRVYQGIRFRSPSSALSPLKTLKHASSMSEFHEISWVAIGSIGGNALRIGFTESLQWVWAPLWIGKWATAESLPIWMNLSGDGWSGFRGIWRIPFGKLTEPWKITFLTAKSW